MVNGVSLALALVAFFSAWQTYRSYPPPLNRAIWGGFTLLLFAYWIVTIVVAAVVLRRTGRPLGWPRSPLVLNVGIFAAVMGVIWLFMPWGPTALQHITLLFATSYCLVTALSSDSKDGFARRRILGVMGSLAAVCWISQVALWPYLTAYLLILTAALIMFDRLIRAAFAEAQAARAEAERARDARTRFLAAATHDLGQPLQAARLFHEQAVRAPSAADRAQASAAARDAFEAVERLLRAMLDHLRLAAGAHSAKIEDVDVRALFDGLVRQFAAEAGLHRIDLRALPTRAHIAADRHLCERILGNFIDNALRHSDARRVRLAARQRDGGGWRLVVADDGCGLGDADPAALFEDYVQGPRRSEGGFGLGLSSARRAAALMRARAGHDPHWDNGSQFYLEFDGDDRDAPVSWRTPSDPV